MEEVFDLSSFLEKKELKVVFQPVVDLFKREVWGYEVLARSVPYVDTSLLFNLAEREGKNWDLDSLCREKTIESLSKMTPLREKRLFLNVTPSVFMDDRFCPVFSVFERFFSSPSQIIIELTERCEIDDYGALSQRVDEIKDKGFRIAIDDMGAGHSGLLMLASCIPDYIKLDMGLIRDIDRDPRKQHVVRSIVDLASHVESRIVAEGVETWCELETLMRLGVRFVQGYLFARPSENPVEIDESHRCKIKEIWNDLQKSDDENLEGILSLTTRVKVVHRDTTCRELWNIMKNSSDLDHVVVLEGDKPVGLITRSDLDSKMSGAFGFHLYQDKSVQRISKKDFLFIYHSCSVRVLSKLAMERHPDSVYDPVVVIDARGDYMGTVTMKQVIKRSGQIEVERALTCNPLSGLPGNQEIHKWISSVQRERGRHFIVYGDLDRFKEYNDTYGFLAGDDLIKSTSSVLSRGLQELGTRAKVGHVGGDDFIAIVSGSLPDEILDSICDDFDRQKKTYFKDEHVKRGFYESLSREGNICKVPLVTLSLAVLLGDERDPIHPARLAEIAASLKHRAKLRSKKKGKSSWVMGRVSEYHMEAI